MTKYFVRDIIQEQDTKKLVAMTLELDDYCQLISKKIFNAMYRYEELTGNKLSDDYLLRQALLDAIGLTKRLPKNILTEGDQDEGL
jgi:hypothetical protein